MSSPRAPNSADLSESEGAIGASDSDKSGAHWEVGETLADRFRAHASDSRHLYGYAMRGMAEDWEAGGPTRIACRGYENAARGAMIQFRLLAGVFRLVLTGEAPELLRFYPCLGGTEPARRAWPVMREVIAAHVEEIHAALAVAPQTNEVGRSAALLAGLFDLVATSGMRRIRLLELGASAGLNLLLDQYAFRADSWHYGPSDSKVLIADAIVGADHPGPFEIVARAGCDLNPVEPTTADGRLLLTSFVWPFDLDRHRRLAAALEIAASHPVRVDKAPASEWLADALTVAEPDTLPVVWHSITQMYWPPDELAAVERILAGSGAQQRLGEVSLEFDPHGPPGAEPELRTQLWSPSDSLTDLLASQQAIAIRDADKSASPRQRLVGTAHHHGVPVRLVAESRSDSTS
jgi:hypothetical protein